MWLRKWPTRYIARAVWGVSDASARETKSDVAHKWAEWLDNPSHLEGPWCFTAGTTSHLHPPIKSCTRQLVFVVV